MENCPLVDCDLCPDPHYMQSDTCTNVVLHQIDLLADPAIINVIILQVVLQEVSGEILSSCFPLVCAPMFDSMLQVIRT